MRNYLDPKFIPNSYSPVLQGRRFERMIDRFLRNLGAQFCGLCMMSLTFVIVLNIAFMIPNTEQQAWVWENPFEEDTWDHMNAFANWYGEGWQDWY